MRDSHPLGLNHVLAALKFLEEHHLVETVDHTDKRELKIYQTTDLGKTILNHVLLPEKQLQHDTNPTR
jgi:DNA-binding PadR family transcriptional regulator